MKKLMIAAAVAAMGMMTFADEAQVYDITMNLKCTTSKVAKSVRNFPYQLPGGSVATLYYRTQTTRTWKGLIWGCHCDTIWGQWAVRPTALGNTVSGTVVWDVTSKEVVYLGDRNVNGYEILVNDPANDEEQWDANAYQPDAGIDMNCNFDWDFLQAIDKDGKKTDGVWYMEGRIAIDTDNSAVARRNFAGYDDYLVTYEFTGAGFGTYVLDGCDTYVKSITGNFAGWMRPGCADNSNGCLFCGKNDACHVGYAIDPCSLFCGSGDGSDGSLSWGYPLSSSDAREWYSYRGVKWFGARSAAFGTWTIAYNASLSKQLANKLSILDVYNFSSLPAVKATIETCIEKIDPTIDPTKVQEKYAEAKANYDLAVAAQDAADAVVNTTWEDPDGNEVTYDEAKDYLTGLQLNYLTKKYDDTATAPAKALAEMLYEQYKEFVAEVKAEYNELKAEAKAAAAAFKDATGEAFEDGVSVGLMSDKLNDAIVDCLDAGFDVECK